MPDPEQWHKAMRLASIGFELVAFFILLLLGGMWLDGKLGTQPLLTLLGAAAGFGIGMYRMISDLRREERRSRKDRQEPHDRDRMS